VEKSVVLGIDTIIMKENYNPKIKIISDIKKNITQER